MQIFLIFSTYYIKIKYLNCENFWLQVFYGFTSFGMSWTRFDYFYKMCLSVCLVCLCVCDKNFVASVARELMNKISWNFIFSITPTYISVFQLLVEILQQMALQSNVFQIFRDAQISASIGWNEIKNYIQYIHY